MTKPNYDMPVISIDFDGCIVTDEWPEIGDPIPGAIETINAWYDAGYWIIINSCRDKIEEWNDMFFWLRHNCVSYHAINQNLNWRINKYGTDPRKIGADIYIDDHNIENCLGPITEGDWDRFDLAVKTYVKLRELSK